MNIFDIYAKENVDETIALYRTPPQEPTQVGPANGSPGYASDFSRSDHSHQLDEAYKIVRTAVGGSAQTSSGTTVLSVCTLTFPAQAVNGVLQCTATLYVGMSIVNDQFEVGLFVGVAQATGARPVTPGWGSENISITGQFATIAGASLVIETKVQRLSGTGTISTFSDVRYNRIDAIWIPN